MATQICWINWCPLFFPFWAHLCPPEGLSGSWKDNGSSGPFTPSSNSSSGGYWSWSAPSDQSNPSTPSPPLSADSFKPFRGPGVGGGGAGQAGPEDPSLEEQDGSSLLFDEPIPRKRKVGSFTTSRINKASFSFGRAPAFLIPPQMFSRCKNQVSLQLSDNGSSVLTCEGCFVFSLPLSLPLPQKSQLDH